MLFLFYCDTDNRYLFAILWSKHRIRPKGLFTFERSWDVHCSKLFTLKSGPYLNGIQFSSCCSSGRIYWECPTLINRHITNRNQIGRGRHEKEVIGIDVSYCQVWGTSLKLSISLRRLRVSLVNLILNQSSWSSLLPPDHWWGTRYFLQSTSR